MRKISLFLVGVFLLLLSGNLFAQEPGEEGYVFTIGNLTYTVITDPWGNLAVSVRATNTTISGELVLPEMVEDEEHNPYYVYVIPAEGFKDCTNLTRIIATNAPSPGYGILEIGQDAFKGCTNLESIYFSSIDGLTVTDDNGDIFEGCDNLTTIVANLFCFSGLYGYTGGRQISVTYDYDYTSLITILGVINYRSDYFYGIDLEYHIYDDVNKYVEVDAITSFAESYYYEEMGLSIPSSVTYKGQTYTVKRFSSSSYFVIDLGPRSILYNLELPNTISPIDASNLPNSRIYNVAPTHPSCTTINGSLYSKSNVNELIRASYNMTSLPTNIETIGSYALACFYDGGWTLYINHDVKYVEDNAFFNNSANGSNIYIAETGSLPLLSNYTGKDEDFIDRGIWIKRQLPVDEFSLMGVTGRGMTSWSVDEDIFYENNSLAGFTSGKSHSAVMLPFYYAGNSWGVDAEGSGATDETVKEGEGFFVYPTRYMNSDGTTLVTPSDSYVYPEEFTWTNRPVGDFDLDLTNTNSTKWFVLSNPFTGRLNLSKFYTTNTSALNNTHAYVWDNVTEHDWVDWADIDTENKYALRPGTGFMAEGAGKNVTFSFDDDDQVSTETINTNKTASADKLEFVALSNGIEKKMYAHIDDVSSNGFGRMDASVLCSAKEDAVNPYMAVEGHNLLDNYFSSLPATFDVSFNAYKSNTIDFALTKGMQDVEVTLIDLANENAETVLNVNEPVTITVTAGQNEGRYQLRFSKKNVGINEVASEENTIQIWNNNSEVTISGKDLKKVEIYNTLGQMVYSSKLAGSSVSFNSGLTNGAYIIKATDSKSTKSEKIIIR